ncbi:MAG: DNA pilot protein [Microviridae sp.]|nr:MAG: DNA pilot protein [Microviridae sp.]
MAIPLIIPAITGIASLIGSIASQRAKSKTAERNTNLTIAENKKLAELAYQREQNNISEMMKYNSPSSQMKRFEEAGLNKNLIYTQGNPGNQSMIAKYSPPQVAYSYQPKMDLGSAVTAGINGFQEGLQVGNLISQGKILKAQSKIAEASAEFARTLELNKVRVSNINLQKLERDMAIDFNAFSQFFEPSLADYGGSYWTLKPGNEKTFVNWVMATYLKKISDSKLAQTNADINEINLDYQRSLKQLSIAMPILILLFSFLWLFIKKSNHLNLKNYALQKIIKSPPFLR